MKARPEIPSKITLIPLAILLGPAEECPRQLPGLIAEAGGLGAWRAGRRLDAVLAETAAVWGRSRGGRAGY